MPKKKQTSERFVRCGWGAVLTWPNDHERITYYPTEMEAVASIRWFGIGPNGVKAKRVEPLYIKATDEKAK